MRRGSSVGQRTEFFVIVQHIFSLPLAAVGLDGLGLPSKPFSQRIYIATAPSQMGLFPMAQTNHRRADMEQEEVVRAMKSIS